MLVSFSKRYIELLRKDGERGQSVARGMGSPYVYFLGSPYVRAFLRAVQHPSEGGFSASNISFPLLF